MSYGVQGMAGDIEGVIRNNQRRTSRAVEVPESQDGTTLLPNGGYTRVREQFPLARAKYHKGYLSTNLLEFMRCDAETIIAIDSIIVANVTDSVSNFSIQHVPRGASTGVEYSLFNEIDVRKNASMVISDAPIYLVKGDALYAQASIASSLVMTVFARRN